jgi:hypothetical protein
MPEMIVRCPGCGARMKVPPAAQAKESIRCPKCKGPVPLRPPAPPVEEVQEVLPTEEEFDELEEVTPAPARAKRRLPPEDEEEDEDDRPRRRGKRRQEPGPWPVALALAPVGLLLGFAAGLGSMGTRGLPEAQEGGAVVKILVLLFAMFVGGLFILLGVLCVKERKVTVGRWTTTEVRGPTAIVIGMIYSGGGGMLAGFALYGVVFEVAHLLFG